LTSERFHSFIIRQEGDDDLRRRKRRRHLAAWFGGSVFPRTKAWTTLAIAVPFRASSRRQIATGGAGAVVKFAFAPVVSGEIGVSVYRRGILCPRRQEKFFQIEFGFW
jgi:hypothetical protein